MLASIAADDMAQTMRVLAGENAVNAARYFTTCSYYRGDRGLVALWSHTMQALVGSPRAAARRAELTPERLTQSRLVRERVVFQGVRYEDVDAATLALEEPPAIVVTSPEDWVSERFGFVRTGGSIVGKASLCKSPVVSIRDLALVA